MYDNLIKGSVGLLVVKHARQYAQHIEISGDGQHAHFDIFKSNRFARFRYIACFTNSHVALHFKTRHVGLKYTEKLHFALL